MGRDELEVLKGGVVKRKQKRRMGLFINGVGLDRATRRLEKKVDLSKLVTGITAGIPLEVARYYTLVPYEDDARQFAFLDAVERAGLEVVTKRLPPKGVQRQVSMDVHIATDITAYCSGRLRSSNVTEAAASANGKSGPESATESPIIAPAADANIRRVLTVVCPGRDLSYAIFAAHNLGAETTLADFGIYNSNDAWLGIDRWVDLSTSETIWR